MAVLGDVISPQRTIITAEGGARESVATVRQAGTMAVLEDVISPQRKSDTDKIVACEREAKQSLGPKTLINYEVSSY